MGVLFDGTHDRCRLFVGRIRPNVSLYLPRQRASSAAFVQHCVAHAVLDAGADRRCDTGHGWGLTLPPRGVCAAALYLGLAFWILPGCPHAGTRLPDSGAGGVVGTGGVSATGGVGSGGMAGSVDPGQDGRCFGYRRAGAGGFEGPVGSSGGNPALRDGSYACTGFSGDGGDACDEPYYWPGWTVTIQGDRATMNVPGFSPSEFSCRGQWTGSQLECCALFPRAGRQCAGFLYFRFISDAAFEFWLGWNLASGNIDHAVCTR